MNLSTFVNKWLDGVKRTGSKNKTDYPTDWVDSAKEYTSREVATNLGINNPSNINKMCREGVIPAIKNGKQWIILGKDVLAWRGWKPENTDFSISGRLSKMKIRQLNEETGLIQTASVVNVFRSGLKNVYEVRAGKYSVAGSADHLIMTFSGWKKISELTQGELIAVQKRGKKESDKLDSSRLRKVDGAWRVGWQSKQRIKLIDADPYCRNCSVALGTNVHHIVPVHQDKSLTFSESNITLLCEKCHKEAHKTQGWQTGCKLYCGYEQIDEVVLRGEEETYDLEISGQFPNFIANDIIVHNSRSSASSRAIPVEKMIRRVEENPAIPIYWGKNKPGMSASEEIDEQDRDQARNIWLSAAKQSVEHAKALLALGVHKEVTNRLLEPFLYHEIIVTSTDFENFFNQRCSPDAQPEIRELAVLFRKQYLVHKPQFTAKGEWHLPFIRISELPEFIALWPDHEERLRIAVKVSVARCARVSYLQHDGVRSLERDLGLYDKLAAGKHLSPTEHSATPCKGQHGNFEGWRQHRQELEQ